MILILYLKYIFKILKYVEFACFIKFHFNKLESLLEYLWHPLNLLHYYGISHHEKIVIDSIE